MHKSLGGKLTRFSRFRKRQGRFCDHLSHLHGVR